MTKTHVSNVLAIHRILTILLYDSAENICIDQNREDKKHWMNRFRHPINIYVTPNLTIRNGFKMKKPYYRTLQLQTLLKWQPIYHIESDTVFTSKPITKRSKMQHTVHIPWKWSGSHTMDRRHNWGLRHFSHIGWEGTHKIQNTTKYTKRNISAIQYCPIHMLDSINITYKNQNNWITRNRWKLQNISHQIYDHQIVAESVPSRFGFEP